MSYTGQVRLDLPDRPLLPHEYVGVAPEFVAVLYKENDIIGFASATLSLVPPMILVAHLAVFLCRREASDLWFAGGQVFCEASNKIFKHLLSQPRPDGPVVNMPGDSYGMPSAHSQFMGYVTGYVFMQLLHDTHIPTVERVIRAVLTLTVAGAVGFSRWYLYYHSAEQVLAGLGVGALLAIAWYYLGHAMRKLGVFAWGLSLWPCRVLCVKDSHYDVRKEYEEWQQKTNKEALENKVTQERKKQ